MMRRAAVLLLALMLLGCERDETSDAAMHQWIDEQRKLMKGKVPVLPEPPPAPTDDRPAPRPDPFSADGFVRGRAP